MLKDVRYFLAESTGLGVPTQVAGSAEELYAQAAEDGPRRDDFAAVIRGDVASARNPA